MGSTARKISVTLLALSTTSGSLSVKADYPSVELRGRMHLDYALHQEDQIPLADGVLNRRTRVGVNGDLDPNWSFTIEHDFSEGGIGANSVNLARSFKRGEISVGQTKTPMGLNQLTGSNNITFIERSSITSIVTDSFRLGIYGNLTLHSFLLETMIFGRSIGDNASDEEDMPLGFAGRVTLAPTFGEDHVFHMGASMARVSFDDTTSVRYRDRPESRPGNMRLVDTGNVRDVTETNKYGFELAYLRGPFSMEAEYLAVEIERSDEERNLVFDGYHVQSSWVLTGESRGYGGGSFGGVRPNASSGAWELAARYSWTDLNDGEFWGGEQSNLTLGINYYANRYVRFMLNYIFIDVRDSTARVGGEDVGDESPRILLLRTQFAF